MDVLQHRDIEWVKRWSLLRAEPAGRLFDA
jgi:hypothetical protein